MQKRIPYAVGSFEKVRQENYYYIDKTEFIPEIEKFSAPVFLRPRRFGKSLWCSVLECYYDLNMADDFDKLFGNLYIGKHPTAERNKYMVMRFNLSLIQVKPDIAYIEGSFNNHSHNVYDLFLAKYKDFFTDFDGVQKDNSAATLENILEHCKKKNLPPVFIIIDEYDNFTNQLITSHNDDLYKQLTSGTGDSFLKTFFKVIKAGLENQSIVRSYLTGVLPITIDDLTSGFNLAEVITLKKNVASMLGFTEKEVNKYVADVFEDHNLDKSRLTEVLEIAKSYYNGYQFIVGTEETLYNSTILNYFLKSLIIDEEIPREFIDHNVRVDLNWLRRLSSHENDTRELLNQLIFNNELPFDVSTLQSKFNMSQFFEKDYYPMSLFYLGLLTIKDDYSMTFPNQTLFKIFTEYFNDFSHFEVSKGYTDYFRQFMKDLDLEKLFAGYWQTYIGQIPAQAFDKANENFFRTTFFELCTRYLSRTFSFAIETNYPSGRCDWEMLGKYHSEFKDIKYMVEFKYFSKQDAKKAKILELTSPRKAELEQIETYSNDAQKAFPTHNITKHIIYIVANTGFRFFKVQ